MDVVIILLIVVVIGLVCGPVTYRIGYRRGYAAKERVVWDENGERIKTCRMSGGYQPIGKGLDSSDPPQGGSGVPKTWGQLHGQ